MAHTSGHLRLPSGTMRAQGPIVARYIAWFALLLNSLPTGLTAVAGSTSLLLDPTATAQALIPLIVAYAIVLSAIHKRKSLHGFHLSWLIGYCLLTMIALIGDFSSAGASRSARLVVMTIVCYKLALGGVAIACRAFVYFCTGIAVLAIATEAAGINEWPGGRLGGFVPALHPNALAAITSVAAVMALVLTLTESSSARWISCTVLLCVGTVLTGSRTSIGVLFVVSIIALVAQSRTLGAARIGTLTVGFLATTAGIVASQGYLARAMTRRGTSTVDDTFSGRSFAWRAALAVHHSLRELLLGQGLQLRSVHVDRAFVNVQGIDGTFFSTYVQVGILGTAFLGAGLLAVIAALGRRWRKGGGLDAVLCTAMVASFGVGLTESVLNDLSLPFVLLIVSCARLDQQRRAARLVTPLARMPRSRPAQEEFPRPVDPQRSPVAVASNARHAPDRVPPQTIAFRTP